MKRISWLVACSLALASAAHAWSPSPVVIEVVGRDGRVFREFPVAVRDGALRSYLQAEKGERYEVRVRNTSGQRLGLVIAVDGRNIINGRKSELARGEPMYVLDAWSTPGRRRTTPAGAPICPPSTNSISPTGVTRTQKPLATAPRAV